MVNLMLRPPIVFHAIVEVDLLELVAIGKWASADVHLVLGVLLHSKD